MIEIALAAQILLWIVVLGLFLVSGQASVFHPVTVYLAFHWLVFVLRPILVQGFGFDTNWNYMMFKPTDAYFVKTLAVSSVALVCFTVACLLNGRSRLAFAPNRDVPLLNRYEWNALLVSTLILLPVIAYSIYATRNGVQGERVNGVYIMNGSTGYLNDAQHLMMPLLGIWLVATRFHWGNLFPVLVYICYRTWFGWSRWTILLFLLMTVLIYCWYHRKKWVPLWSCVLLVPILMVFNVLGHNRDALKQMLAGEQVELVQSNIGMSTAEKLKRQLDTQDYSNFDYLTYVVSTVPERTGGYTFGAQYLQLFTEPVPRILWKGKPVGSPVRTIDMSPYGNFVGLTVSLCGDAWTSGGWVGLIVTLSLVGAALGRAHRWFWTKTDNNLISLIYLVGLAMVPQWYRDGGISIAKFLFWGLSPLFLWGAVTWIVGLKKVPGHSVLLPSGATVRLISTNSARAIE